MHPQTVNAAYRDLLFELYYNGVTMENERTGSAIKTLHGGWSFKLDISDGALPIVGNRRMFPKVAAAEVAWQFGGVTDPKFIMDYAPKLWGKFIEEGEIKAAYGYRWRKHFGRDQIGEAITRLHNEPSCRQVFISTWDPAADGLGAPNQPKNIPCITGFNLTRVEDRLHSSIFLRSSDAFIGLPYDIMSYALTVAGIAVSLGCLPGTLHFTLGHPHLYSTHFDATRECLEGAHTNWVEIPEVFMPTRGVREISDDPDFYVSEVSDMYRRSTHERSNFAPDAEVVA